MPTPPDHRQHLASFLAGLNARDQPPTWNEASTMGMQLIDMSREELAIRGSLADLEQADQSFDAIVDPTLADAIVDHRNRLALIEERPGAYFLSTGEVIQHGPMNVDTM